MGRFLLFRKVAKVIVAVKPLQVSHGPLSPSPASSSLQRPSRCTRNPQSSMSTQSRLRRRTGRFDHKATTVGTYIVNQTELVVQGTYLV